ncbi:nuclear transport factor 2 family protein [Geodermatophilus sp. SYSU D01045]
MDEQSVRAALEHYVRHSSAGDEDRASEIYHEDAVLEFPQSGERFEGVANFREWRRDYPARVDLEVVRVRGRDDFWVVEVRARYDGGPWMYGPAVYEFRGDRVARETIYIGEAWEAPEWRARWRAAP